MNDQPSGQSAGSDLRIAWLIPCYNEESTVARVVADIKKHSPGSDIYVFDNASTDQTSARARDAGAIVRSEKMRGKGTVVRRMFQDVDADLYLLIDGDTTYNVSEWRKLAQPIVEQRAEMTVGTRLSAAESGSFRSFHTFGNRLIAGTIRVLFRIPVTDVLSGYRAFSRRFVKSVSIESFGFEVETELTIKCLEHRLSFEEVSIPYGARPAGSHSKLNTVRDGLIIFATILGLLRDLKPITFCSLASLLFFVLGAIAHRLEWPFATLCLSTLGSVAIFSGLILNAIARRSKEISQAIFKWRV